MNKSVTTCILSVLLLASALSHGLNKQSARLQAAISGSYYQLGEAFVISLPEDLEAEVIRGLTLEVDNIDVTAMTTRKAGQLVYQSVTQLAHGGHELRLVYYGAAGSVTELGYWEVEVRQSARFREAALQGEFNLGVSHRVAESADINAAQSRDTFMHSNGQVSTVIATSNWRTEGNASLSYVEDPALSLTGHEADIPTFFVGSASDRFALNMGDHAVAMADLLNDGYQRRGLSSSIALPAMDSALTIFSASANQRVGIEGGLGISDSENRVSGARWQYQPVHNKNARIVLSSSFLAGKVSEADFATITTDPYSVDPYSVDPYSVDPSGDSTVNDGEAWNVTLDSLFFQQQLRMRFEKASSRYDFDGLARGFAAQEDEAWSALLLFDPAPGEQTKPVDWSLGVEAQRTGTYFKSINNRQLPADKEFQRAFVNGSRDEWNWNASYAEESNNLDENPDYALTHTSQWVVGGGFQDYAAPPPGSWLGQPAFNWYATGVEVEDEHTPAGYLVNDVSTRSANANVVFNHASWNWSLGYNHDTLEDHSGWQPQTRTRALMINTSMQLSARYYLALGWQLQQTDYVAEAVDTRRQLYSLEAHAEFIPDRLSGNISIGVNQNNALDDPYYALRDKFTFASGNLNWRVKKPQQDTAGLDLTLSLVRNEFSDFLNTLNDMDGYQVVLKINTILPLALPDNLP